MPDWVDEFMSLTEGVRSPWSFRLWTAIATIACVLERRVWTVTDAPDPLSPNLFTVLAGGPASGKSIMVSTSRKLLVPLVKPLGICLAPDDVTKASFLDELKAAEKFSINGMGSPMYSALTILCLEFGVLLSKYDNAMAAALTTLYDNPPFHSSTRRQSTSVRIEAPCINALVAATPDALDDIIPAAAWGQGLTSRLIFIYGASPDTYRDMFTRREEKGMEVLQKELVRYFEELHGEFEWEKNAQDAMRYWFNVEKMAPRPTYGRLVNYLGRRNEHVMKLAMVSAVSAGHGLSVTLTDFHRAQRWLFDAEKEMPDVFRAMAQKSDAQLLQDAHHWMYTKFSRVAREKRVPITERELWNWFENKTTHDKIKGLMNALEATGRMRRAGLVGDWIPNPLDDTTPTEVADTHPEEGIGENP